MQNTSSIIHYQWYPASSSLYTLVFIHGAMCSQKHWAFQVAYFYHKGYQILTCDLPGHGLSPETNHNYTMADFSCDLSRLINHLNITTPIILIGHSMGARIAIETYLQNRSSVSLTIAGLTLIDSGYSMELNQLLQDKDFNAAQKIVINNDYDKWCEEVFDRMVISSTKPHIRELILLDIKRMNPDISMRIFTNFSLYDCQSIPKNMKKIKVPILALQSSLKIGAKRLTITKDTAKLSAWLNLVKTTRTHQIQLFARTGHFIMLERPNKVNQYLDKFITGLL